MLFRLAIVVEGPMSSMNCTPVSVKNSSRDNLRDSVSRGAASSNIGSEVGARLSCRAACCADEGGLKDSRRAAEELKRDMAGVKPDSVALLGD